MHWFNHIKIILLSLAVAGFLASGFTAGSIEKEQAAQEEKTEKKADAEVQELTMEAVMPFFALKMSQEFCFLFSVDIPEAVESIHLVTDINPPVFKYFKNLFTFFISINAP